MLNVIPISAFKDNYIWLLVNPANRFCAIVDPGDAGPVLNYLQEHNLTPCAILITHHHHDHTGGIDILKQYYQTLPIYGPATETIPQMDHKVDETNHVKLEPLSITFNVYDIPGHTKGHIAYYGDGMLFCGDTLFAAGCGRLFEGTAQQLYNSLRKIAALPDNTLIYCGHEYTAANLRFAAVVEPDNIEIKNRIKEVATVTQQQHPTLPSVLHLEKLTNPFLRCHIDSVINSIKLQSNKQLNDPVSLFQALREWKDTF
jgi:hydroxyacylglutathione hydrolase